MITPGDYEYAGLTFDAFAAGPTAGTIGVGGRVEVKRVNATCLLTDDEAERVYRYSIVINVAPPIALFRELPTLLGRDLTDNFRLIIDPTNNFIALDDPENYR